MPEIKIKVRDKCADGEGVIICNNSDYTVVWDLDEEWTPYDTKTMRVNLADGTYQDVVFTGNTAALPVLTASGWVSVGLYAGDLHTSRAARLLALSSVLTPGGSPAAPAEDVYAQIMTKLNELSTVSPEDIAKAVEDYLSEHPIEETDPTVPEWAKAKNKPTYSAAEVGAISQSDLQAAMDAALAQAKASGEFDGPQGPAGAPGKDGTAGADGITPTIGDNGNWYIGSTDTGKPSRGATGATGPHGPAGAGMDITGATVGQIAKIAAVDASGVPTAWSPVDMPSGGGESNTFGKVVEMTTIEDAAVISISTDKNGNPLSMSEFYVAITTARNSAATANNNFNCNVLPDTVPTYVRTASAIKSLNLFQDVYCYVMHYKVVGGMIFHEYTGRVRTSGGLNVAQYLENEKAIGIIANNGGTIGFLSPTDTTNGASKIDSSGKMYCITFGADSTECIFGAGTRVEVWAR